MSTLIKIGSDTIDSYEIDYSISSHYSQIRSLTKRFVNDYYLPYFGHFKITKNYTASSSDYYTQRHRKSIDTFSHNLYPIAVRYVSSSNVYVIERPPFQLEVDFRMGPASSREEKLYPLKIWIPWTVMLVQLDSFTTGALSSVRLYFNDSPLTSLEDIVFNPWLPNSYSNGSICFSNSMNDFANVLDPERIASNDINYIYNYIFNNYMMGGWNSDLSPAFSYIGAINPAYNTDAPAAPVSLEYMYPSSDAIKNILSNVPKEHPSYKKLSSALRSKRDIRNYTNNVSAYLRHFGSLSNLTLEQTLSLITELKTHYAHSASSGNSYSANVLKTCSIASRIDKFEFDGGSGSSSSSYTLNAFYKNVFASLDSTTVPYDVCSNYVYIENQNPNFTYDDSLYGANSRYSDLYIILGKDNVSSFNEYMLNLFNDKIQNVVVKITFDPNGIADYSVLTDSSFSTLMAPHIQALSQHSRSNQYPGSSGSVFMSHLSDFALPDYFERSFHG